MITHTGMFSASCMQNTKVTMKKRMTNAFRRPSGSRNAEITMSAWHAWWR